MFLQHLLNSLTNVSSLNVYFFQLKHLKLIFNVH